MSQHTKRSTVLRRLRRRMRLANKETLDEYLVCRNLLIYLQREA